MDIERALTEAHRFISRILDTRIPENSLDYNDGIGVLGAINTAKANSQAPASGGVDEKGSLPLFCRVYNSGYHAGHHDTVEGGYTHIYPQDMDDYHEDVVMEILEELQQEGFTHPPAKVPEALWEALADCVSCFNCPEWSGKCEEVERRATKLLNSTTPTPATTAETEWVRCEDQMPPDRKAVIVWCYASGCCGYAHYSYEKGDWLMPEPQPAGYNHISHWMHFPAPPQEQ